jgi:hypothetical protein
MIGNTTRILAGTRARYALALLVATTLVGCFDDAKTGTQAPPTSSSGGTRDLDRLDRPGGTPPTTSNDAPRISGEPLTVAKVSLPYSFQPKASDPDGDKLTFQIKGKPDWINFDPQTGRLQGTPPSGSTGTYTGVQIIVSDGTYVAELPPFSISVQDASIGSAELAWEPPTANEDGSPLTDLAGYVIRYGRSMGGLDQSVKISNAGTTMFVVEDLSEGTWYFSLSCLNSAGVESRPTGYVSTTIG